MRCEPAERVRGRVQVPGDKSISHRALLVGGLAPGRTFLANLGDAADVAATVALLRAVGVEVVVRGPGEVSVFGRGRGRWSSPAGVIDCANSGSTMRMGAGALAGHPLQAVLDGDQSLRRRPMARVAAALEPLGAAVACQGEDGRPPLRVTGLSRLRGGVEVSPEVPSAQLKTAVLLAGLAADGPVTVREAAPTRDHTERLLRSVGLDCATVLDGGPDGPRRIRLVPGEPEPFGLRIPGDLSSAAAFLALAAAHPRARVRCEAVGLNPGRVGLLEVLRSMGAAVEVEAAAAASGEPAGTVTVGSAGLRAVTVGGSLVPRAIDELPLVAVLATQAEGTTVVRDATELRVKETDRIAAMTEGLRAMGATVEGTEDGWVITGPTRLRGALVGSLGDHRIAMALAVAACLADGPTTIEGADCVAVSFPGFFQTLGALVQG